MAFDSTGVYTLPTNSFAQPVGGTVIDNTTANTTFTDWQTAFNNCVTKYGLGYVSTQFDVLGVTTLANVTGLSVNVTAGKVYSFEAVLFVNGVPVPNSGGGGKAAINGSCTATNFICEGHVFEGSSMTYRARTDVLGTAVCTVPVIASPLFRLMGLIVVNTAGTLAVQFAQNSVGLTSSVLVGSHFRVWAHT